MRIALIQNAPFLSRKNLDAILTTVAQHSGEADLIVFPELALSGYMLQDKLYEDAFSLDELKPLIAASATIDIVVGVALRDGKVFRNAALYLSDAKILYCHHKVHLPNYGMFEEARYFTAGKHFKSFETSHAKVALLICEDIWKAETHMELFREDPDIVLVLAASPARGFEDDSMLIESQWSALLKSLALHCKAKVVFVNRVGFEDGLGFWGGSSIIGSDASVLYQLPKFENCSDIFVI